MAECVESTKAKKQRRRSSLSRGRRSSVGFALHKGEDGKKLYGEKDLAKLIHANFKKVLKEIIDEIESASVKAELVAKAQKAHAEILTEMKNDDEFLNVLTSTDYSSIPRLNGIQDDIDTQEKYSKKLKKQCRDWDRLTEKCANEDFSPSEIDTEVIINTAPYEETASFCINAMKDLNHLKENLLIKVDKFSTDVECQKKNLFNIQTARREVNVYGSFGLDKLPQPDPKVLILE